MGGGFSVETVLPCCEDGFLLVIRDVRLKGAFFRGAVIVHAITLLYSTLLSAAISPLNHFNPAG